MSSLTADQVALQLDTLPNWQQDGNSLIKTYQFADFATAMAFIMRVAFYAESLEHYPTWENYFNTVKVRIGDAKQGAVQSRDVQLAKRMESAAAGFTAQ
ncbi:pterin-4-alpha-carbinolamine dehydratase [Moraxella caviae]|uniref:4a-hydroxytetrahydrobiopterin dehydratase n=1 Tax=Moraxella caviae TaxID=34060 RepID=A0A1T0A7F3_9GAMM|nr:4a-hydroxytetrahydrobiopterin dehydratase [Moraxella caviae]OOR91686.1 pterin-4-alpha-carbinolamine dehydratase [Moraxella caviae]STZ10393.1 Putative pterin-4-alpha-carbinolamine dehydratase [Moraxella caviae]